MMADSVHSETLGALSGARTVFWPFYFSFASIHFVAPLLKGLEFKCQIKKTTFLIVGSEGKKKRKSFQNSYMMNSPEKSREGGNRPLLAKIF